MESQSGTQLKVGIFLTIGIIVFLVSIFMLGADRAIFTKYVRIHSHFDQVQGLAPGSVVSLSGITVGNVEQITFNAEKNSLDVQMKVDSEYANKIASNSQVEIRTQGALGDKFVFIIPGDAKSETIKENDVLAVARPTDIFGIISERGNETSKIFDIINELYKLTKQINAENRVDKIMTNITQATASMKEASLDAKKAFAGVELKSSMQRLDSILAKIDRGEGSLGALINDPSVHNQLKSILGVSGRKNNVKSLIRTSIEKEGE